MSFCPKCGAQNPDGAPFCSTCGSTLNSFTQAPKMQAAQPAMGLAIPGMICGIASLVLFWCWGTGLIPAIVGLILSILAKKKGNTSGIATAGLICSAIGLGLNAITLIACISCFGCAMCEAASTPSYYYY